MSVIIHNYSSLSSGSRYCKPEVISWWKVSITVFYTRFLSPTDQKCAESSVFWQFFYYCPPSIQQERLLKCDAKNSTNIYIDIDITLLISDMDFLYQFNLRLHHFWRFFFQCSEKKEKNQKLAGLWLVGEVVNHVVLYGSKVAEGCSAFQRRSCNWMIWSKSCFTKLLWARETLKEIYVSVKYQGV